MTFVVTEACIKCKYMDCVEVCPVDCFYEGADAWLQLNRDYSEKWPNITQNGESPPDAKKYDGVPDKFEEYFSPNTG